MSANLSPNAGPAVATYMSAGTGVGLVIVDVDKDGVIEDGDTAVLVRNHHASVTDIAFGKQEINYAYGDPHMAQADASSGYTGQMEDNLRQLAQSVYDQLRAGQGADSQVNAFVAAADAITSNGGITDQKFDFHNDIAFINRNGVRTIFDVKIVGNVAVTENVDVQVVGGPSNKKAVQVVEFDNLWLDQAGDQLSGGGVRNATAADQTTTLPIFRAVSGGDAGYNYGLTVDGGKANYLFADVDWQHVVKTDGSVDTAGLDFVKAGFVGPRGIGDPFEGMGGNLWADYMLSRWVDSYDSERNT